SGSQEEAVAERDQRVTLPAEAAMIDAGHWEDRKVIGLISRFFCFNPTYCVLWGVPSSSSSSSPPRCADPPPCSAIVRSVTSAPVTAYRTGASALCTKSDTASPATNSSSRCRTSSNVQIGQIGRLSLYSASNFMNS